MADRIALKCKSNGDWIVKAKGANQRDIDLCVVPSGQQPPVSSNTMELEIRKDANNHYIRLNAKGIGFWYIIPRQNSFKIRIQTGITIYKDLGGTFKPVELMAPQPSKSETDNWTEVTQVHDENPRWVKIGTKWYYIG